MALLMMVSMGARADVKVLFGEKGTELQAGKDGTITLGQKELTGGTIIISQVDQKDGTSKVTFAVTPGNGYQLAENGLEVYAVIPTDISPTRGLEVSTTLTLKSEDFKDEDLKRTYTTTIDSKLALWVKSANFLPQKRDGAKANGDPVMPSEPGMSGLYYIVNNNTNAYSLDAVTNWYMVPASDGGESNVTADKWTWKDNTTTPLVTTYQTKKDDNYNSVWAIVKNSNNDNYYFIHLLTGSYMTYNTGVGQSSNRRTFHMETNPTTLNNNHLFKIISYSGKTFYSINPVEKSNGHMYMNPSNGNKAKYYAFETTDGGYTVGGTIGLYNKDANSDQGSKWFLEKATLPAPTITYDSEANTFTISYDKIPVGFDILYSTDGNEPTIGGSNTTTITTNTEPNSGTIAVTGVYTVKAVIARYGMILTEVAEINVGKPDNPIIAQTGDCSNTVEINSNGTIYYTTDGSEPDDSGIPYTEPFVLNENAIIKAIAYNGTLYSDITELNYTPTFTVAPIITISDKTVSIVGSGTIYYTKDNSDPTVSGTRETYTGPLDLPDDSDETHVKAIAQESGKEASCVVEATYIPVIPGYYALHASAKGYLKRSSDNVTLANEETFRYGNSFDNNGSSIWALTSEGYLQSDYYYLNVANNTALYFSVYPVTRWSTEDISGETKKHLYIKNGATKLYLCNDGSIALSSSPTNYYNACPITLTEKSLSDATAADLTVQSPQQVTYLRNCYFTQKIDYSFVNDAGTTVSESDKDRRVFVTMTYKTTSDANKGSKWDFDEANGIIYNKTTSSYAATATYELLPADPFVRKAHPTAVEKSVKFTLQPGSFTPVEGKNYLLFNVTNSNTNTFRYPYDQTTALQGDRVMPDKSKTALTDPTNNLNQEISWLIEVDDEGFYSFKNKETGRYIYYDASDYSYTDYGVAKVGATLLPSGDEAKAYKFRLYKTSYDTYGDVFSIIPYEQQFVVFKNDGVCNSIFSGFNIYRTPNAISLWKPVENASKWKIYAYEAEDRLKSDYSIQMGNTTLLNYSTSETGTYNFTATSYYSRNIVGSPVNNRDLEIYNTDGTTTYSKANVTYTWTVTGLDSYTSTTDNSSGGDGKLAVSVNTMPASTVEGTVSVEAKVDKAYTVSNKDLTDNKTVTFSLITSISSEVISIASLSQITSATGNYKLTADISDASNDVPTFEGGVFSGILDGGLHTISGLETPLFASTRGAVVKNVILKDVKISQSGNVGAITGMAGGYTRIYNCGILPSNNLFSEEKSTIASTDAYCGGLVGYLGGDSRVVNCYSYATITGGTTVGGIVGFNETASDFSEISGQYANLKTMVVNCIFYGEITGGSTKYPVYGGRLIRNDGTTSINLYDYFRGAATFDDSYTKIEDYNRAWPAEDEYLTRFEYYRSILNSNRQLCGWWVKSDLAPSILTKAQVQAIEKDASLIAKWVLDPSIAPFPILKAWGKYPSVINRDVTKRINPTTKLWEDRVPSTKDNLDAHQAPDTEGQTYGTIQVTINAGNHHAGNGITSDTRPITITAMDVDNFDYCYGKIQLPYYNDVFGDPDADASTAWNDRYGGNYTDYVVTGWMITAVTGGTSGSFDGTSEKAWESGFNFADRKCTDKDKFSVSKRVFAQGGYYYVPEGVTAITIEAYWGKAVYLRNANNSVDRVNVTNGGGHGTAFAPAGTLSNPFNWTTVKNSLAEAIVALGESTTSAPLTVYDQAIVLVGNYQKLNGSDAVGNNVSDKKWHPFTIMSADFDMDNEPDYCMQWQFRKGTDRPGIQPIRFDFLPVPELGLAIRHNNLGYAIGVLVPQGHFEITETAFMHTTQFEYDANITRIEAQSPLILNGGHFEQIVVRYGDKNRTSYILMGGNFRIKRFTPGYHATATGNPVRHCAVNAIGGEYPEFYLSGIYRPDLSVNADNPHCYTNGGYFGLMAGAGYERVNGNVTFKIDHSIIDEFYGGGINGSKPITGSINVTINNSSVGKYCGGPKVGVMDSGKTVTTDATGTTFNEFYGGGNGGTSYYREQQTDGTGTFPQAQASSWAGFSNFNPINTENGLTAAYDDAEGGNHKGYHAEYEFEIFKSSNGLEEKEDVIRAYYLWAQFGTTTTGDVTNTLTDCIVKGDFFGGGNLANVTGNIESTLTGNTQVYGSAFGAGYSASIPSFRIHDKSSVKYPKQDFTGTITEHGSLAYIQESDGKDRYYTWSNEQPEGKGVTTSTPTYQDDDGNWYCYTTVSLDNLGTVSGDAKLTIEGNTKVGSFATGGSLKPDSGNVYGGGAESIVGGNTIVTLQGNAEIFGNVFGGGDKGVVEGSTTVNILAETPTNNNGSGNGSGEGSGSGSGN